MLDDRAKRVLADRYTIDSEDWEQVCRRQGHGIAKAEPPEKQKEYVEQYGELIYNLNFIPAGRILRGMGRPQSNLLNCFVLDVDDSMKSIGSTLNWMWELSSEGGGVGIPWSKIRPYGEELSRKGGVASGPVSFMSVFDTAASVICSGGARRAALKADLNISHPDILRFIAAKLDNNNLNNFNISVGVTKQFLEAVRKNRKWELRFGGKVFEKMKARELWNKIMQYAVRCGEPGIVHVDNMANNNSWYYSPVISTNPCGEQPMEAFGSCCLGHINLTKFLTKSGRTKWQDMEKVIHLAVRFLDNIIEVNNYVIPQIREAAFRGRRIGLGVLGLADYLFSKEIRYGSERCVEELDNLFAFIRNSSYLASVVLAKEKGSFQAFDRERHCQTKFIRRLPRHIQRRIYENGIRNVTLNTCAPTGTIHQLAGVTSGIEPLFSKAYIRRDKVGEVKYIHSRYRELLQGDKKTMPEWYVDAYDITPFEHLEVQATIQRYTDGAIAKTINCPAGTTAEELSKYLLKYIDDLKGVTVYVDGSRDEQILYPLSKEEALKHINDAEEVDDEGCPTGTCDV